MRQFEESRKIFKLGTFTRLIKTLKVDDSNNQECYKLALVEKRFKNREPHLLVDLKDKREHIATGSDIIGQISFYGKECSIHVNNKNLCIYIDETSFRLDNIEILNYSACLVVDQKWTCNQTMEISAETILLNKLSDINCKYFFINTQQNSIENTKVFIGGKINASICDLKAKHLEFVGSSNISDMFSIDVDIFLMHLNPFITSDNIFRVHTNSLLRISSGRLFVKKNLFLISTDEINIEEKCRIHVKEEKFVISASLLKLNSSEISADVFEAEVLSQILTERTLKLEFGSYCKLCSKSMQIEGEFKSQNCQSILELGELNKTDNLKISTRQVECEYLKMFANRSELSGIFYIKKCEAISLECIVTNKELHINFEEWLVFYAQTYKLSGKIESSTIDSKIVIGKDVENGALELSDAIIKADIFIILLSNVTFKSSSTLTLKSLTILSNYLCDYEDIIFNVTSLVFNSNQILTLNGNYFLDEGIFICPEIIDLNENFSIHSGKLLFLTSKNVNLSGKCFIQGILDIKNAVKVHIKSKAKLYMTSKSSLMLFSCKIFEFNGQLKTKLEETINGHCRVSVEIFAEDVVLDGGSIDGLSKLEITCKRLCIKNFTISQCEKLFLNVTESFSIDSFCSVDVKHLKMQFSSKIIIKGKLSGLIADLNTKDDIVFDNESYFNFGHISLMGKNLILESFSKLESICKFDCCIEKNIVLKSKSHLTCSSLTLTGVNLRLLGKIRAKKVYISLDGYFLCDYFSITDLDSYKLISNKELTETASSNEEKLRRVQDPTFTSYFKQMGEFFLLKSEKDTTIICSFFINLGSPFSSRSLNKMCLIALDFLSVNVSYRNSLSSLVSLDLCLNIPNIFEIVQAIITLDFKKLKEIFFDTFDLMTAIGLFINLIKFIFPQAGAFAQIGWNLFLFLFNLPNMIRQLMDIVKQGKNKTLKMRHVIPFIVGVKNVAFQAISIYTMASSINLENVTERLFSLENEKSVKEICFSIGETLASSFGPSISNDSLISLSLPGLNLASNVNTRSILALDYGRINMAQNIYKQFVFYEQSSSVTLAKMATYEGIQMETNNSRIHTDKLQITLTDTLKQLNKSIITADDAKMKMKIVDQQGLIKLENSKIEVSGKHEISVTGEFVSNSGEYSSQETNVRGDLSLDNARVKGNEINVHNGGKLNVSNGRILLDNCLKNFSGGQINLTNMEASIKESYVMDFQSQINLVNSSVETNDAQISGATRIENSQILAKNTINVSKEADFDLEGMANMFAKEINWDAKTKIEDAQLNLIAEKSLTLTSNSEFRGKNTNSSLFVKSETGHIDCDRIELNKLTLDIKNLDKSTEFAIGNDKIKISDQLLIKTDADLVLDQQINHTTQNLSLIYNSIDVKTEQNLQNNIVLDATQGDVRIDAKINNLEHITMLISENGSIYTNQDMTAESIDVDAHKSYFNKANIMADGDAIFNSSTGVIENSGGTLKGNYAYAKEGILNLVKEEDVRGRFDTMKSYTSGKIEAGSDGAEIYTEGKMVNYASDVLAKNGGNVSIYAEKGFESMAAVHEYLANVDKSSGFLGFNSKTTRTYDTQVQKSTIGASGTVDIYSEENISGVATDFISSGGKTTLHADKGRVDVSDLVVQKRVEQNKNSWWGLSKNSSDHKESYSIKPTLFSQSNDIDIISDQNDVCLKNVRVFTPKSNCLNIDIGIGRDASIVGTTHDNTLETHQSGLTFDIFGQRIIGESAVVSPLKTVENKIASSSLAQLKNSNSVTEFGLNLANSSMDTINAVNVLYNASCDSSGSAAGNLTNVILDKLGLPSLLKPPVSIGYEQNDQRINYQTFSGSEIHTGQININKDKERGNTTVLLEGLDLSDVNELNVSAETFKQKGIALNSSSSSNSASVKLNLNPESASLSSSFANNEMTSTQYLNQNISVSGVTNLNVKNWEIEDANVNLNVLEGKIDNLKIVTHADRSSSHSQGISLSTNGAIGLSKSSNETELVGTPSSLTVSQVVDADKLKIKNVQLVGAKLLSSHGQINLSEIAESVNVTSVKEYEKSNYIGIQTNLNEIQNALRETTTTSTSVSDTNTGKISNPIFKQIASLDISKSEVNAIQKSVIKGEMGTILPENVSMSHLTTNDTNGREIIDTTKYDYHVRHATFQEPPSANRITDTFEFDENTRLSASFAKLVYNDREEQELPNDFAYLENGFINKQTNSKVEAYVNESEKVIYIVFKGTGSVKEVMSDIQIGFYKQPDSYSSEMQNYLSSIVQSYGDNYTIKATGHSLGAQHAALASSQFGIEATVFDIPGLPSRKNEYDFSRVHAIQSTTNFVNYVHGDLGKGRVSQFVRDKDQKLEEFGISLLKNGASMAFPFLNWIVSAKQTIDSHEMEGIAEKINKHH